jgi:hypothetical protein
MKNLVSNKAHDAAALEIRSRHVCDSCKVTGLGKSTIIPTIEPAQISGIEDLFGEWKVTVRVVVKEGSIHNDYPQRQYAPPDETNGGAEIAELVRDNGDSLHQSFDEKDHEDDQCQQPERSQSPFTGLAPWSATSAHGRRLVCSQARSPVVVAAGGVLAAALCVCWIAIQSVFLSVPPSTSVNESIKSSSQIPGLENERIRITPTEDNGRTKASVQSTPKLQTETRLARADDPPQSANRASVDNPILSVPQQKSTSPKLADLASQQRRKILLRAVPVPETRPTTIQGWMIREVVGDGVILQGPNGIWMVTRGDTVPGLGKVNSIVRWGKRWIVATNKGLISTP